MRGAYCVLLDPSCPAPRTLHQSNGDNPDTCGLSFVILAAAPLTSSTRSRPAWIPVQLKEDSGIWISPIVKWNKTRGVNGTIGLPVNITAQGHAIGVIMMGNVASRGRMSRMPATARYV